MSITKLIQEQGLKVVVILNSLNIFWIYDSIYMCVCVYELERTKSEHLLTLISQKNLESYILVIP